MASNFACPLSFILYIFLEFYSIKFHLSTCIYCMRYQSCVNLQLALLALYCCYFHSEQNWGHCTFCDVNKDLRMHFLTKSYDLLSSVYKMLRPFSYCWLQRLYLKAKRILELMNVEKLRRENIATHLQVLRYGIYFHNDLTIRVLCLPSMIHEHLMQRERETFTELVPILFAKWPSYPVSN